MKNNVIAIDLGSTYTNIYKLGEGVVLMEPSVVVCDPTKRDKVKSVGAEAKRRLGKTISANVTDYINIDCDSQNAYRLATENKNSLISGNFPLILPGANTIGITGTTTKVEVTPRFFTI